MKIQRTINKYKNGGGGPGDESLRKLFSESLRLFVGASRKTSRRLNFIVQGTF